MALTQVNSEGIKDGEIKDADVNASAAIAGSKLAAATTSAAGSMSAADKTKLDGVATSATANPSAPALTGSTNNTVCTVTGANAIQGEANLTFDGSKLDVTSPSTAANDSEPIAVFTTQGHSQIRLNGDGNQWSMMALDGGGSASGDFIIYDKNNDSERIRIESGGNVKINDGDLVIGTAGHGIDFSATSDGTTMSSELLNDYEEGTFTAAFRVEGQSSNVGTSTEEGKYTKIGNTCTLWMYVAIDGTPSGTAAGNAWEIRNLPFTSVSDTNHHAIGNARCHNINSGDYGSDVQFIPRIWNSSTVGRLEAYDQGDYGIKNASTYMKDNAAVMITITYCCA